MAASQLRVIAGRWRSRRLSAPPARTTRPMPDRVKEAVFDVLGTRLDCPGRLPEIRVLDLFAGSGSMGIEALSRGATECVFVERSAPALGVLRDNLVRLEAKSCSRVVVADAWRCPADRMRPEGGPATIIFVDPPYRDARDTSPSGKVSRLLERVCGPDILAPDGWIVLHHERSVRFETQPELSWRVSSRREYGTTAISFIAPADRFPDTGSE